MNGARVNAVIRPVALERSDSDDQALSGYADHDGKTDCTWKPAAGMCRISGDTCAVHDIPWSSAAEQEVARQRFLAHCPIIFRQDETADHDRGQCRTQDTGNCQSGASGSKDGKHGRCNIDYDT